MPRRPRRFRDGNIGTPETHVSVLVGLEGWCHVNNFRVGNLKFHLLVSAPILRTLAAARNTLRFWMKGLRRFSILSCRVGMPFSTSWMSNLPSSLAGRAQNPPRPSLIPISIPIVSRHSGFLPGIISTPRSITIKVPPNAIQHTSAFTPNEPGV